MDQNLLFILIVIAIILLLVVVVILIANRISKSKADCSNDSREDADEIERRQEAANEIKRRQEAANGIKKKIKDGLREIAEINTRFKVKLKNSFGDRKNTYVISSRKDNPDQHEDVVQIFLGRVNRDDSILYFRRNTFLFGSDNFFIITQKGIGYAPSKQVEFFYTFDEINSVGWYDDFIVIETDYDEGEYLPVEDFVYCHDDKIDLIEMINGYLNRMKTELSVYIDAGFEAINKKALPIIPTIIEKIGTINPLWKRFFSAYYKYLLASDGVDVVNNCQEAIYLIDDMEDEFKDCDNPYEIGFYCHLELLRAHVMLINEREDHMEIKRVIDKLAGGNKDSDLQEDINIIRRQLII